MVMATRFHLLNILANHDNIISGLSIRSLVILLYRNE